MNTNAVRVPTHKISSRILKCIEALIKNFLISDIYLGIDNSDPKLNDYREILQSQQKFDNVRIIETESESMLQSLNQESKALVNKYLTFMGDDHIVRTFE